MSGVELGLAIVATFDLCLKYDAESRVAIFHLASTEL